MLGKWSAIAMLELQRIVLRFAGWALTEGQHRSFFSGSHFALDASSGSGLTQRSPTCRVYHIVCCLSDQSYTWIGVDRQGLVFFRGEGGSKRIKTYPVQVRHTLAWMFRLSSGV